MRPRALFGETDSPTWRHVLGVAVAMPAGAAFSTSFSPLDLWPAALLGVLVLYWSIYGLASLPAAFCRCFAFALGKYGVGAYWIYLSLHDYADVDAAVAGMLFAAFLVVVSTIFAFVSVFAVRTRSATLDCAVFAAGMCLVELVLTLPWAWSFPWLHLGYALVDLPLASYAPLGGVWLVSLLGAFSAVALRQAWRRRFVPAATTLAVWIVGWAIPAGLWTTEEATIRVALVQGNVPLADKWAPGSVDGILSKYRTMTRSIGTADLVVWPETAVPTTLAVVTQRLADTVEETGIPLVAGVFERSRRPGEEALFNAIVGIDGSSKSTYRKRQLVPFAEYTPLRWLFGGVLDPIGFPMSSLSAANGGGLLRVGELRLAVAICYEIAFPQLVNPQATDADLIATLSEDSWLGDSTGPWQHLQIARMRALETGRYVVRATNDGVTAIVDPKGDLTASLPRHVADVLEGRVSRTAGTTPFARFGMWAVVVPMLIVFGTELTTRFIAARHRA
ncbi:MAG: apolipoprotein N-acyltransferase [Gammaproteobacteria bacterium]|nr:apolipoprotein N-acyltransferase [Gammaproteobacteria bacterium]